jgi:IMP dehydrogenase
MREALTFNDVLIPPAFSDIDNRSQIDITTDFLNLRIKPVISSPMDHVSEGPMVWTLGENNYYGIYHRFRRLESIKTDIEVKADIPFAVSIGVKDIYSWVDWLHTLSLYSLQAVCIDVAHGDHQLVLDSIALIKKELPELKIIAGNIATPSGYGRLAAAGADAIRVGIGSGSACTTRSTTGIGVPQLTAIMDCVEERRLHGGPQIIADGGIESAGDIVKALAAGADVVMLGKMLAGHDESPGEIVVVDGKRMKPYRGQSMLGSNGHRNSPEGIAGLVPYRGKVMDTLNQLEGWIKSGLSYVGAANLTELRRYATFIKVSPATQQESNTRILELR